MVKKAKFVFDYENLNTQLNLEEIVALISTGDRNSPEYLQYRGMIVFDKETNKYRPAIHFSNALQKLAISWETLVTEQK